MHSINHMLWTNTNVGLELSEEANEMEARSKNEQLGNESMRETDRKKGRESEECRAKKSD